MHIYKFIRILTRPSSASNILKALYIYIYIYIYIYTHTHTRVQTQIYECTYTNVYAYLPGQARQVTYSTLETVAVHTYIHTYTHTHTYIYTHTQTHIHIQMYSHTYHAKLSG